MGHACQCSERLRGDPRRASPTPRTGLPGSASALFERLLTSREPRLQQAAIILLLTQPALAGSAIEAVRNLTGAARDRAMRRYVAAVAMQRMARTRIVMQLGPQPDLPEQFSKSSDCRPLPTSMGGLHCSSLPGKRRCRTDTTPGAPICRCWNCFSRRVVVPAGATSPSAKLSERTLLTMTMNRDFSDREQCRFQ